MTLADRWQSEIRSLLEEHWGIEDIALNLGIDADSVREMVKIMRRKGVLDTIYNKRAAV